MYFFVKGLDFFALFRLADYDFPAAYPARVEGVQGLPVLHKNVVGDVHDVVYGAQPRGLEVAAHPFRRRGDFYAFYGHRAVHRAVGRFELDGLEQPARRRGGIFRIIFEFGFFKLPSEFRGKLPRDSDVA